MKKAAWMCDAFRRALPQSFPQVKAVLWFQEAKEEGGTWFAWPIDSSDVSREGFAAAVAPAYYAGDLGDLPSRLGRQKIPEPGALPAMVVGLSPSPRGRGDS
jgi:hypothetical protein